MVFQIRCSIVVSIPARHAGDLGSIPSGGVSLRVAMHSHKICMRDPREIRTPNLLIWSQTRCRCAIEPLTSAVLLWCVSQRSTDPSAAKAPLEPWSVGLMDKALASGARDSRFKSWADHARGREAAPSAGVHAYTCASAGNRTPVTSMATMYSTTRPLMQARDWMKAKISNKLPRDLIAATHRRREDRTPTVGLEPTTTRLRALRSAD